MGSSTIKLSQVIDTIAAKGIPDPRGNASGYGDQMVLDLATQVMADIACERFNWKWNRADAVAFMTNSWQQDYPQVAQPAGPIGWGEDCDIIDINNTTMPKPLWNVKWRRGLSRTSTSFWRPGNICWMENKDLFIGNWPGAGIVFAPLLTTQPQPQNPIMSMTDANGNILIVTGFGTTLVSQILDVVGIEILAATADTPITAILTYFGANVPLSAGLPVTLGGLTTEPSLNGLTLPILASGANTLSFALQAGTPIAETSETGSMGVTTGAPQLPAGAAEGTTVPDGTVVWTCVLPTSQGFRLDCLPTATGTSWLVKPYYQIDPVTFSKQNQTLDPMPNSFSRFFYRGLESELLIASPNPGDLKRGQMAKQEWMMSLVAAMKQGDREPNIYGLIPAVPVVAPRWEDGGFRTVDNPYGW